MNLFKTPLQRAFAEMERTLTKNVANDLFDITFHEHASDDELMLFYGGGVDREALITDTRRKLDGDQRLLRFYQQHKDLLTTTYGTKDATADFNGAAGRDAIQAPGSDSDAALSAEGGSQGPAEGSQRSDGHEDDAAEGHHDNGDGDQEHRSGGEPGGTAAGAGPDARGGEAAQDSAAGSGETLTLTLPTESEARRLELERITREVGTIEKTDGDEVTVRPFAK